MSADSPDPAADKPADRGEEEEEGSCTAGSSTPAVEQPRKRKGAVEERSDAQRSLDCQMDDHVSREPHRQIEKRRRDKMNNLIDELSAMIPACQPMARKLDKLTVLRKAVQYLKSLKAGASGAFTDSTCKPSLLPQDDLWHLLLRVSAHSRVSLITPPVCLPPHTCSPSSPDGQRLPASREMRSRQDPLHLRVRVQDPQLQSVGSDRPELVRFPPPQRHQQSEGTAVVLRSAPSPAPHRRIHWSSDPGGGARQNAPHVHRSSPILLLPHEAQPGCREARGQAHSAQRLQEERRLQILHAALHRIHAQLAERPAGPRGRRRRQGNLQHELPGDHVPPALPRLLPGPQRRPRQGHGVRHPLCNRRQVHFCRSATTLCTLMASHEMLFSFFGKATTVIGYLPQEVLGTSCYEYFHQDDLQHLAAKHREVLRSKEKIETQCYKFKTKHGSYVSLQSQWFSFTNPWTKEVEFIVSLNRVISGPGRTEDEQAGASKALHEEAKPLSDIPGLSGSVGTMIYAGSIGTQIANELVDTCRANSSPSSGASSPFGPALEKCPQASKSASEPPPEAEVLPVQASRDEEAGSSSQSQSGSRTDDSVSGAASENTGESSQLDLEIMGVSGLSSFSSDEAAMAVIMSLLETDVNMSQSGDFEDLHWPF
uniref:Basic helix-loop-helix ARNT like 2 n=1 Tax=Oryzias sinensis TaxID=183150 RepID=A0A8C7VCL4_9TELE